ncbi:hypothetical protein LC087_15305 [Bacillus carboniphilus]|uniref:Uncharacterized protein n=1 Tax=Bacillus carboniphilus TaxID=86663 RepID=A0ABY9JRV3_9BACI|nr:hypothetical protein [Bacillus carboniphilus]WLR42116.1 hypothetical protein LC087_15305 [Bacillus carboniphilus]
MNLFQETYYVWVNSDLEKREWELKIIENPDDLQAQMRVEKN